MAIQDLPPIQPPVPGANSTAAGRGVDLGGLERRGRAVPQDGRQDRVEVSEYARLLGQLQDQIGADGDLRETLIARLRAEIGAGTYTVNARHVAERIYPGLEASA